MVARQPAMISILTGDIDLEISHLLDSVVEDSDTFGVIACLTKQGTLMAISGPLDTGDLIEVSPEFIDRLDQANRAVVVQKSDHTHIAVPIYMKFDQRELLGMLQVAVDFDEFLPENQGYWSALVDGTGLILHQYGPQLPLHFELGVNDLEVPLLGRLVVNDHNVEWPRRVIGPRWHLLTAERYDTLYASTNLLRWIIILLMGGASLIILLLVYAFHRSQQMLLEQLEASQAQVTQSAKLAALGNMVAGVGHELNNPLMGIMNYVTYAKDKSIDPKIADILAKAETAAQRIANILKDMTTFAQPPAVDMTSLDLVPPLRDTIELIEPKLKHLSIDLDMKIPTAIHAEIGDTGQFTQAILNLLLNAIDALEECSDRKIQVAAYEVTDQVVVEVTNNGPSISEDIADKIFDPFYTTKRVGSGTGLGLSISRNFITSFGGSLILAVNSEGDVRFRITLQKAEKTEIGPRRIEALLE